jgi:Sulfotransferase family
MTFRLLMLGAMYENGGNTTHRLLDGHPGLRVYPFESQLGTALVHDHLTSMFPVKYRWPVFDLAATPEQDYEAIIDEETRVRARTPHVSKFRHVEFEFSDSDRKSIYVELIKDIGRSRPNNVEAFFRATFEAWRNSTTSEEASGYVGYSPIVTVDADKILADIPDAHVLHVVRNPWSAYADTCKRPVPLSLAHYMLGWTLNQQAALFFRSRYPDRLHLVRIEDVLENPRSTLGAVLDKMGLPPDAALDAPSWNGTRLEEVYPWGTIRRATPEANRATAAELPADVRDEIRQRAEPFLASLDYIHFM